MLVTVMKSKIHRATITEAVLEYEGSITIDRDLLDKANMFQNEKVQVLNMSNGSRLETYVMNGERGSGIISLNGPAARLGYRGDEIVVIAYGIMDEKKAKKHKPIIVKVDKKNRLIN